MPGVTIRVATEEETRLWFTRQGAGGDWAEPDGISFMTIRCTLKLGTGCSGLGKWRAVAPAALEVREGVRRR